MDWIKVKLEHLSFEYSNAQLGALLRYHAFYAQYGREPTDLEISKLIGKKDLAKAEETFRKLGGTLKELRSKVDEDRLAIDTKREANKERQRKFRSKQKNNALHKRDVTGEIREDKIREDNNLAGAEQSSLVPELIKLFEEVNPACKKMYGNTTQRKACQELIDTYGFEEVSQVVRILPQTNKMKYITSADTPHQLWNKYQKIKSQLIAEKEDRLSKKVKIAF